MRRVMVQTKALRGYEVLAASHSSLRDSSVPAKTRDERRLTRRERTVCTSSGTQSSVQLGKSTRRARSSSSLTWPTMEARLGVKCCCRAWK